MPTRWESLAGDTDVFAIKIAFMDDPDAGQGADEDLWRSWGAFQIWVEGTNICAHKEEGETVESVHWYVLPLLEWIASSWDPLLHEERLPCANIAHDGWTGLRRTAHPSLAMDEREEIAWEAEWQQWWLRHGLAVASEGGIFPDVVFRRFQDLVEISWGETAAVGVPDHFSFIAPGPGVARFVPADVAEPLHEVIRGSSEFLHRLRPDSPRISELRRAIRRLRTRRVDQRLMWLAGAGRDEASARRGWQRLKRWLSDLPQTQRQALLATPRSSPLVVDGSCHAALMYGSVDPSITKQDMLSLAHVMVELHSTEPEHERLAQLCEATPLWSDDPPWAQGYELAEDVHERLGCESAFDIRDILAQLGIEVLRVELADTSIRGVAVAGPHHKPASPGIHLVPSTTAPRVSASLWPMSSATYCSTGASAGR